MSYVVKCTLRKVDHIDLSPAAMTARNDDWKSRTGFLGLKGGINLASLDNVTSSLQTTYGNRTGYHYGVYAKIKILKLKS